MFHNLQMKITSKVHQDYFFQSTTGKKIRILFYLCLYKCFQKINKRIAKKLYNNAWNIGKVKYFLWDEKYNMGDALNTFVVGKYYKDSAQASFEDANFISIGSIMHHLTDFTRCNKKPIHIWGAGFMFQRNVATSKFTSPIIIHALRGKLTKECCESLLNKKLDSVALGDPGLLTSKFYSQKNIEILFDVGVIPHFYDKDNENLNNIQLSKKSLTIIDITKGALHTIQAICQCRVILSSSLHGLVIADSYNIPNKWIELSDKVNGKGYKFRDYYSVFNISTPKPIDLRTEIITDSRIESIIKEYPITPKIVKEINHNLEKSLPDLSAF